MFFQEPFLADDLGSVEAEAEDAFAAEAADEEVVLELGKGVSSVENGASGGGGWEAVEGEGRDHSRVGLFVVNRGPAVVLPFLDDVDFIATGGAVFGFEKSFGAGLEIQPLAVSMAVGPDFGSGVGLIDEGVVLGDLAVFVQSEDFAGEGIEALGEVGLVGVSGGDVELAVRTEAQATPGVVGEGGDVLDNDRAIGEFLLVVFEADDSHLGTGIGLVGIGEVEPVISAVPRMENHAHGAEFSSGVDVLQSE